MKIAFIQPRSFHTWEAINIGYLASYLKARGYHDIDFYSGFFDSDDAILQGCLNADIIGFSCTSPQMAHALKLATKIKRPDNHIVFGGVHPSALPQDTIANECVDAVVVGDGEQAFLEIVQGNKDPIVRRPYLDELTFLPFPDRRLIKQERNIRQAYNDNGERIASLLSSRGCPFRCAFCASHQVWMRRVRYRAPQNILEEFERVVKDWSIDFIKFSDDTFTVNKRIVIEFCENKIKMGIKTPWGCNIRADTVDEETLTAMRSAQCREVWVGIESGSPQILKDMKKDIAIEEIRRCFKITAKLGFLRRAYILLGMPNEDYSDIRLTEELVDEIKPDSVGFTILAPYPGTEFYQPDIHAEVDWSVVDEYENRLTATTFLSNEDLHREQQRLVSKYQKGLVFRHRKVLNKEDNVTTPQLDKQKELSRESYTKRIFDILLALTGLILSSPLWLFIMLAIWLEDRGPIFYFGERVGKGDQSFKLYKFRSMYIQRQGEPRTPWTLQDDPRVTKMGRLLRNTAADELPQLINIVKGDMSFVGPRPEDPYLATKFSQELPRFRMRHCIRPGLTGPAQIYCAYDSPISQKLYYDMLYIERMDFWFDIKLILLSFWVTLRGKWEHRGEKV